MPVYRDEKHSTWYLQLSYKDWTGKRKHTCKRGFKTKREAVEWERTFMDKLAGSIDMDFESFAELYLQDIGVRVKESTLYTKRIIIRNKLIPFFGKKRINSITTRDVILWQNEMMSATDKDGKGYSKSYLRTMNTQLNALFNHGVRYYGLPSNPAQIVGGMGAGRDAEVSYWTLDQYRQFANTMMEYPTYYYAFEVLYWCGIREGELLALTPADIDLGSRTLSVTKTFHHLNGRDYVTDPKTRKSRRKVTMPDFLCQELQEYMDLIYKPRENGRLFPISKSNLIAMMKKVASRAELPDIRVHDLRHSHVSLLIDMGYSAVAIAERVGHETVEITYRYAHMFPSVQSQMAASLDGLAG